MQKESSNKQTPEKKDKDPDAEKNLNRQGIDKAPEEEKGKGDKVTPKNLKGKQVDADPDTEEGKPLDI